MSRNGRLGLILFLYAMMVSIGSQSLGKTGEILVTIALIIGGLIFVFAPDDDDK
jgi:hypothetical protein